MALRSWIIQNCRWSSVVSDKFVENVNGNWRFTITKVLITILRAALIWLLGTIILFLWWKMARATTILRRRGVLKAWSSTTRILKQLVHRYDKCLNVAGNYVKNLLTVVTLSFIYNKKTSKCTGNFLITKRNSLSEQASYNLNERR